MASLLGIDTGGTFTDFMLLEDGRLKQLKVLSTPEDPSKAIVTGMRQLGMLDSAANGSTEQAVVVIHGTTVGTNAVLEGKGAEVAYVTSSGFADVLTLGRQNRKAVYQLIQTQTPPPVPPDLCLELATRITADGELLQRCSDDDLAGLSKRLQDLGVEAVAVNLLFSFLRPEEEQRIADSLADSDLFVSLSSTVLSEIREYERGIATWMNASIGPVISRYLKRLSAAAPGASISVMQSAGTTISAQQAAGQAVRLLLSGPAGGLAAARFIGELTNQPRLMTFDMGGTSTDVAMVDGDVQLTTESRVGDYPVAVPSVDMHTIGAGGGSLARLDEAGLLLVGPESAGADPGPVCYDQGGRQITVTDANLVLGRVPANTRLGGYLPVNLKAAEQAMDDLAKAMDCSRIEAAEGVIRLANEHMARALRVISVERGHDPREYCLFSFGGAGGLHGCDLAELLDMDRVLIPANGGVLSAMGMLVSKPGRSLSRAVLVLLEEADQETMDRGFEALRQQASQQLMEDGIEETQLSFLEQVDMRYQGQSATITLPVSDNASKSDLAESFHQAHKAAFGHRLSLPIELVNLRLETRGEAAMSELSAKETAGETALASSYVESLGCEIPLLDRAHLATGEMLTGPAIISEPSATIWLGPNWQGRVDEWGNLLMQRIKKPAI